MIICVWMHYFSLTTVVEADALSTHIGILVDGRLRCYGSALHLKGLYGQVYAFRDFLQNDRCTDALLGVYYTVQCIFTGAKIVCREPYPGQITCCDR